MKLVYLHGIGKRTPGRKWLSALNESLEEAGYPSVSAGQVIAPNYYSLLLTDGIKAKHPDKTYNRPREAEEARARMAFERRQADVQRMLQQVGGVHAFGFHRMPESPAAVLQARGAKSGRGFGLGQVRRYVNNKANRGAILQYIIDALVSHELEDIVLIGHSLGSVVAIDLLDHLPPEIRVRRFVTIGSPANNRALREAAGLLLKDFPYARVDDWSNLFSNLDAVTGGRGLASTFPGAQDFSIDLGGLAHSAQRYLRHRALGMLVGDAFCPRERLASSAMQSDVVVRMTDEEADMLLKLHFGRLIADKIKRKETTRRYEAVLNLIQDEWASLAAQTAAPGAALAPEVQAIIAGKLPPLPSLRWEITEAVEVLAQLTTTAIIAPYEIEVDDADLDALPNMAIAMGLSSGTGEKVATAVKQIDSLVGKSGRLRWWAVAGVGAALLIAAPVGLVAAAPASAFGAAAVTGGLAAFGPGGMIGGLATAGGLASTGAAAATLGAMKGLRGSGNSADLLAAARHSVTVEYARKLLDLPTDPTVWRELTELETQLAAQLNRLQTFSDEKAPSIRQLLAAKGTVAKLTKFMLDEDLASGVLSDGDIALDNDVIDD